MYWFILTEYTSLSHATHRREAIFIRSLLSRHVFAQKTRNKGNRRRTWSKRIKNLSFCLRFHFDNDSREVWNCPTKLFTETGTSQNPFNDWVPSWNLNKILSMHIYSIFLSRTLHTLWLLVGAHKRNTRQHYHLSVFANSFSFSFYVFRRRMEIKIKSL